MQTEQRRHQWYLAGQEQRHPCHLDVELYSSGEASMRAAKILVMALVIAGVGAFIPVAHFAIVPGAIIGGIFLAVRALGLTEAMVAVGGKCPSCDKDSTLTTGRTAIKLPYWTFCSECNARLCVEPLSEEVRD